MKRSTKFGMIGVLIFLNIISFAYASTDGSTGTRGGGHPLTLKSRQIEMLIESKELKTKLKMFLENLQFSDIRDPKFRSSIIKIYSGLFQDIESSQYQNKNSCVDNEGRERGASTRNGIAGDEICFSPAFLASNQTTLSELIGITVHEHARHLGFRDEDHSIASFFAKSYEKWVNQDSVKELIEEALIRCHSKKTGQLYRFFKVYRQRCNCMKNKQEWARNA